MALVFQQCRINSPPTTFRTFFHAEVWAGTVPDTVKRLSCCILRLDCLAPEPLADFNFRLPFEGPRVRLRLIYAAVPQNSNLAVNLTRRPWTQIDAYYNLPKVVGGGFGKVLKALSSISFLWVTEHNSEYRPNGRLSGGQLQYRISYEALSVWRTP